MQKQKRKADEDELHKKRGEMDKTKVPCGSLTMKYPTTHPSLSSSLTP
jgi:hypothetical protein